MKKRASNKFLGRNRNLGLSFRYILAKIYACDKGECNRTQERYIPSPHLSEISFSTIPLTFHFPGRAIFIAVAHPPYNAVRISYIIDRRHKLTGRIYLYLASRARSRNEQLVDVKHRHRRAYAAAMRVPAETTFTYRCRAAANRGA